MRKNYTFKNPKTPMRRFAEKIKKSGTGCWLWTGGKNQRGYGVFKFQGHTMNAHRVALLLLKREIPAGMVVDHTCRVLACVNPAHLEVVTQWENIKRGSGVAALNMQRTHCRRGHGFTKKNTAFRTRKRDGHLLRECRQCRRQPDFVSEL